jgi:hypothetical protein
MNNRGNRSDHKISIISNLKAAFNSFSFTEQNSRQIRKKNPKRKIKVSLNYRKASYSHFPNKTNEKKTNQ